MSFVFFASGSDTFVEVGMPRSPSHSANGNELKQMLASCKTSSGKRQAVELLQGTKNSHLQYVWMERSITALYCLSSPSGNRMSGSILLIPLDMDVMRITTETQGLKYIQYNPIYLFGFTYIWMDAYPRMLWWRVHTLFLCACKLYIEKGIN